ncbi:plasmid pRiA4b ORF-3 family protein [Pseudomonas aeruginosa]|uniref:plasmid pRiA4b ORF-3 family protein n=1 Tax=Pseudomonas aeruginosa TaxID=287 RepID=UPI00397A459D
MATQPLLYTLHIQLEPLNFNPPIWRRLRVNGDCTLRKLHHFIQAAFGWHSSHLHEFSDGIHRYLPLDAELMYQYDDAMDDRKSKLRRVLMEADRLRYLYDFGDSWQHVIAVESIEPCDFTGTWCEALDGARACPPEDVGGVPGYLDFLASGGSFDPELFDRRAANAAVQRICNNFWG